jgi:hypothetical protein
MYRESSKQNGPVQTIQVGKTSRQFAGQVDAIMGANAFTARAGK